MTRRTAEDRYWAAVRAWARTAGADGCSHATELFQDCCLEHDRHYRTGKTLAGRPLTRADADRRFRTCMQRRSWWGSASPIAWVRWAGVRLFGRRAYQGTGT